MMLLNAVQPGQVLIDITGGYRYNKEQLINKAMTGTGSDPFSYREPVELQTGGEVSLAVTPEFLPENLYVV